MKHRISFEPTQIHFNIHNNITDIQGSVITFYLRKHGLHLVVPEILTMKLTALFCNFLKVSRVSPEQNTIFQR